MSKDPVFVVCELARPGPEGETFTAHQVECSPRETLRLVKLNAEAHMVKIRFSALVRRADLYDFVEKRNVRMQVIVANEFEPAIEDIRVRSDFKRPWSFESDRS